MKTNEAPEKIYLIRNIPTPTSLNTINDCHEKYLPEWYEGREKDADIEYIRTDAFIEKATQFINDKLQGKQIEWKDEYCWSLGSFIKQFKQAMEGE